MLDTLPTSTNHNDRTACTVVVNIYARTRLPIGLLLDTPLLARGAELKIVVNQNVLAGHATISRSFARLISPTVDLAALVKQIQPGQFPKGVALRGAQELKYDPAKLLAVLEKRDPRITILRDEALHLVSHHDGPLHLHHEHTDIPGVYHLGIYVEGIYYPEASAKPGMHEPQDRGEHGDHGSGGAGGERFTRLLNITAAVGGSND